MNYFYKFPESKYEDLFLDGVEELKQLQTKLEIQLSSCTIQRDRFKEMYYRMRNHTEKLYSTHTPASVK